MIRSIKHKGLKKFFETGNTAGVQAKHVKRLRLLLTRLNASLEPQDIHLPGLNLHKLKGELKGFWAVTVQANWRIIFKFDGRDAIEVNYIDYH